MEYLKRGPHINHCCVDHGCKYNDENCVVVKGECEQIYDCEDCGVPTELTHLAKLKRTFDEIGIKYREIHGVQEGWIMLTFGDVKQFVFFNEDGTFNSA